MSTERKIQEDEIRLHVAGATVRHSSRFEDLEVPVCRENPSPEFMKKWVQPFYMQRLFDDRSGFVEAVRAVVPGLTDAVIAELLAYFNWRPRLVGAYFVAIKRLSAFEEQLGRLLLRSDLCDAGRGYCAALARLNSPTATDFLEQYLDYYLARADLWFDQGDAMAALGYLDEQNGTSRRARFEPLWQRFIENKPTWDLDRCDEMFRAMMLTLEGAAREIGG